MKREKNLFTLNKWYRNVYLKLNDKMEKIFVFHYTSIAHAKLILKSKKIMVSCDERVPKFGRGVFLTVKHPHLTSKNLLENNYRLIGVRKYKDRVQCAFAFNIRKLNPIQLFDKMQRDIWKYNQDICLNRFDYHLILRNQTHLEINI